METTSTELIKRRFSKAAETYDQNAQAQHQICERLVEILTHYTDAQFNRILEIGCGSGGFTRLLKQECHVGEWILNDLCSSWHEQILRYFPAIQPEFLVGDAEKMEFPGRFDLIASASTLQWMKDLPLFFKKIAAALSPEGTFIFNTFIPGNLSEIRAITGIGLHYPNTEQITKWLAKDFQVIHAESAPISLRFKHPLDILRHLKYTGVTATYSSGWTREKQTLFCLEYEKRFKTEDGRLSLSYLPLYILAKKRS